MITINIHTCRTRIRIKLSKKQKSVLVKDNIILWIWFQHLVCAIAGSKLSLILPRNENKKKDGVELHIGNLIPIDL